MAIPTQYAWIDTFCAGRPRLVYSRYSGRDVECEGEITETGVSVTCEGARDYGYGCSDKLRLDIAGVFREDSISLTFLVQIEAIAVGESVCAGLNDA